MSYFFESQRGFITTNDPTTVDFEFQRLSLEVLRPNEESSLSTLTVTPKLLDRIRVGQASDQQLMEWKRIDETKGHALYTTIDGIVQYKGRVWVPLVESLREDFMTKAHTSMYSVYPRSTKMYKDLPLFYWWPGMKNDMVKFVSEFLTCKQVNAEHYRPA